MIQLNNITLKANNLVSMDCHVVDQIENQDFSLEFDPVSRKIFSDLKGIDPYYAGHAVLHVYFMYKNRKGKNLPKESIANWV
ncbi:hypothetical protein [uncultured Succinivibrio sp.]|jgi:hypothetical protein|uniref:hypothetical protein n=1 Tax=uncultured Succinivibrio sp. TaxID=540749 RepID=UPI0025DB6971|nr:hypothetical protein [uncultured Succinivibrio sp.]